MPDTILTDSARKTNNSFPADPNFAPRNGGNLLNGPCNAQEFAPACPSQNKKAGTHREAGL
jgi:hypothetical protein